MKKVCRTKWIHQFRFLQVLLFRLTLTLCLYSCNVYRYTIWKEKRRQREREGEKSELRYAPITISRQLARWRGGEVARNVLYKGSHRWRKVIRASSSVELRSQSWTMRRCPMRIKNHETIDHLGPMAPTLRGGSSAHLQNIFKGIYYMHFDTLICFHFWILFVWF